MPSFDGPALVIEVEKGTMTQSYRDADHLCRSIAYLAPVVPPPATWYTTGHAQEGPDDPGDAGSGAGPA